MDIALITDANYVMPTGVLMTSLFDNNDVPITFHIVVSEDVSEQQRELLRNAVCRSNVRVEYYKAPSSMDQLFPVHQTGQSQYISVSAYYRLFLADILPATLEKILYLDCDIICRQPLCELWNIELEGFPVAAVKDVASEMDIYDRLGYSQEYGYFNSGVLLINLALWRKMNLSSSFISFIINNPEKIKCHDQDVLNCVLFGRIMEIPIKFNLQDYYLSEDNTFIPCSLEEFKMYLKEPAIVHYCSYLKPWIKGCPHPFVDDFLNYKKMSLWSGYKLGKLHSKGLSGRLSDIFAYIGLRRYNSYYINVLD